jgi:hypothetical protein
VVLLFLQVQVFHQEQEQDGKNQKAVIDRFFRFWYNLRTRKKNPN